MSTKIEWCDETINPIVGCTKISEGCQNCYAEIMATRLAGMKHTKAKYSRIITDGKWNGNVVFDEKVFSKPARWKQPKRIFITSMGDLFHENVFNSWLVDILLMIVANPKHTFIILTKRPEQMLNFFNNCTINPFIESNSWNGLFPNLWLGVTAENQKQADERIPILLQIPAIVHFVSCEPMLGHIDLIHFLPIKIGNRQYHRRSEINWVIAGGENGNHCRFISVKYYENLLNQCIDTDTPYFFKGYGGKVILDKTINDKEYKQFPKI